jgi:4Fe-4S ferredoxin
VAGFFAEVGVARSTQTDQAGCGSAGRLAPVVDRDRCEGKAACVAVCPFDVFEMDRLTPAQRAELTLIGRMKAFFHGGRQAFAVRPEDCHACGRCVTACPERAIRLVKVE